MQKQFEVDVSLHHEVMTSFQLHKAPRTPKSEPSRVDNCVRLLPYAYEQHINVFKCFVNVLDGWGKQFEVAVSLNHEVMTSFQLHKSSRTPKSEPSRVDNYVRLLPYAYGQHINVFKCFVNI